MIIYKVTNLINGMVYIGETRQILTQRKAQHLYETLKRGCSDKFHQAIRQFGKENFVFEKIAESNNFTDLAKLEKNLIIEHDSIDNGYNTQIRNDTWLKRGGKSRK